MNKSSEETKAYAFGSTWIIYHCIAVFLWLIALYLMLSVLVFHFSRKSQNPETSQRRTSATVSSGINTRQNQSSETNQNENRYLPISGHGKRKITNCRFSEQIATLALPAASVFTFLFSNIALIELYVGWQSDAACQIFFSLSIVLYTSAIALIYATLWERQRKLYRIETIKHLTNSVLRKISVATLFVIAAVLVISIAVLHLSATAQSNSKGCFRVRKSFPRFVRIGFLPAINTLQQVSAIECELSISILLTDLCKKHRVAVRVVVEALYRCPAWLNIFVPV